MRRNPTKPGNCIGVRTSKYKYYRARGNTKKKVCLYDLISDPDEINNIAEENKQVVKELEELLMGIRGNSINEHEIDKSETERIERDLKPLGKA